MSKTHGKKKWFHIHGWHFVKKEDRVYDHRSMNHYDAAYFVCRCGTWREVFITEVYREQS